MDKEKDNFDKFMDAKINALDNLLHTFTNAAITIIGIFLWCFVWMLLKRIIYGKIEHRTVDDIMTLILIPIMYKAVDNCEPLYKIYIAWNDKTLHKALSKAESKYKKKNKHE